MQWHPLASQLLRSMLQADFDLQTNVSVGDVPREADLVLLRRRARGPTSFRGIWTGLTTWNILEYKSPDVTPRIDDIDRLVELGLGVERRLNEERRKQHVHPAPASEVSFWLLANRLSGLLIERSCARLGSAEPWRQGVWRSVVLGRALFLVSITELEVERETVPLHIVSKGPYATQVAVARYVLEHPGLRPIYEQWVFGLHERAWKEARAMVRAVEDEIEVDVKGFVEHFGLDRVIRQVGLKRVIDAVGLDRVIAEAGVRRVIAELGLDRVIAEVGIDELLAKLTPAQRRALKKRLR